LEDQTVGSELFVDLRSNFYNFGLKVFEYTNRISKVFVARVGFVALLLGDVGVAKYARHKLYKHSLVPVVWVGLQKLLIAL